MRLDLAPIGSAVAGGQNRAVFSDRQPLLFIPKIYVIERNVGPGILTHPRLSRVIGMKDGAVRTYNPSTLVVDKVYVNQFLLRAGVLRLPGGSAVTRDCEDAAHHVIAATNRAYHPAPLFPVEPKTVKLGRGALKIARGKRVGLLPTMPAVAAAEDRIPCQNESRLRTDKVNIVDGVLFDVNAAFHPRSPGVFGVAQDPTVTPNPSTFGVNKIDSVQIAAAGGEPRRRPSSLSRCYRCEKAQPDNDEL